MSERRDSVETADTQHPVDGKSGRAHSPSECPIAEEAHREVRHMHQLLHGNGHDRGVFEQLRAVQALGARVESFDRKLDEVIRTLSEELRLAKEEALAAKKDREERLPSWATGSAIASLVTMGAFFAVKLWEMIRR